MSKKIAAVVVSQTKHVLAAVTRVGNPDGELTAEQLVGDGLPIYDPKTADLRGTIVKDELEVVIAEGDEGMLVAPLNRMIKDGAFDALMPPPAVTIAPQSITVELSEDATKETPFFVLLEAGGHSITVPPNEIAAGTISKTLNDLAIPVGDCNTIVLVEGHVPFIDLKTVS